jgi:hypothetical protein
MKKIILAFSSLITITISAGAQQAALPEQSESQKLFEHADEAFAGSRLATMPSFSPRADVLGTQYLFDDWVSGTITDTAGSIFSEGYLFNFNKVSQNLYMRLKNAPAAFVIRNDALKSIRLSDGSRKYFFEKSSSLEAGTFYNVLATGSKYSFYSLVKTKFVPADYHTNGLMSSGSLNDQFKDELTYYIVSADGKASELPLKKKNVKNFFSNEKEKVEEFFKTETAQRPFGENFVKELVETL